MHFSSTSRNIHLDFDGGLWLCCECQSALPIGDDPGWIAHRFPLHENFHVARDIPKLRYGREGGYALTDPDHVDKNYVTLIGGTILKARVRARSGPWTDTSMCLDFFLTNMAGAVLACTPPEEYLGASVAMIRVSQVWNEDTGHWEVPLTGLCMGLDGQLHASSIDLSLHYVNDNGMWKKKKNGRFGDTAKDVGFDYWGNFTCRLKSHGDWGGHIQVDLYKEVRNVDGALTIDDPAGFWDARGEFFRILEEIPLLGYAVAVADFARGDPDEAQRAIAECTLSTIAAVCSFFATVFLGPVGACLAAAAVNTGAMLAREGMHANMGEPSFFTRSVGSALAGFFFSEFLVIAGAGLGGLTGAYVELIEEEFVANAMDGFLLKLATWGEKKALKTVTNEEFKFIMTTVIETLKNGGSQEEVQAKVDTEIQRWFEETQAPSLKNQITTKMTSLGYTWDDITIPDDVYKVAVAADFQDEARLQTVIEATVKKIIPDLSWKIDNTVRDTIVADGYLLSDDLVNKVEEAVTKYIYREHDNLVTKITSLLRDMSLGDPRQVRAIRLGITRIGYTYDNPLVIKLMGMMHDSDYGKHLDEILSKIFAGLPATGTTTGTEAGKASEDTQRVINIGADRNSLDGEVKRAIYAAGYLEQDGDRKKIEDDLIQSGFVYDYISNLRFQISKLVHKYCSLHRRILP